MAGFCLDMFSMAGSLSQIRLPAPETMIFTSRHVGLRRDMHVRRGALGPDMRHGSAHLYHAGARSRLRCIGAHDDITTLSRAQVVAPTWRCTRAVLGPQGHTQPDRPSETRSRCMAAHGDPLATCR